MTAKTDGLLQLLVSWCCPTEYRPFLCSRVHSWFQLSPLWSCKWANVSWQNHLVFWGSLLPF